MNGNTPRQVAENLDRMVQPRFRRNAGQFGVDRVIVGGHDDVYELDAHTRTEAAVLRRVKEARRPFVIAFLHCRHKPGSPKAEGTDTDFRPFLTSLAAGTETDAGADRLREWADDDLSKVVLPWTARLRQGRNAEVGYGNWLVVMRPVRAERASCLGCHTGARRGDTLGVMVYAIDKNHVSAPVAHITAGEE